MKESEKKKQIEDAFRELEQIELEQIVCSKEKSPLHLYEDETSIIESDFNEFEERNELLRKLSCFERLDMKPSKQIDLNTISNEELREIVEEIESASAISWEAFEEKEIEKMEQMSNRKGKEKRFLYDFSGDDSSLDPRFW